MRSIPSTRGPAARTARYAHPSAIAAVSDLAKAFLKRRAIRAYARSVMRWADTYFDDLPTVPNVGQHFAACG